MSSKCRRARSGYFDRFYLRSVPTRYVWKPHHKWRFVDSLGRDLTLRGIQKSVAQSTQMSVS